MGQVGQPFLDEQEVAPLNVAGQVLPVGGGQAGEIGAPGQFLGEVEDRQ
jgi:hypothetical protein